MRVSPIRVLAVWNRNAIPAFVLTIALGLWLSYLQSGASGLDNALGLAFVVQMFAASTGFRGPAGMGEFDLLLARAGRRWRVVLAHCLVSISPVAVAWVCLAIFDVLAVRRGWPTALTLAPFVAFVWISVAAWAVGAWLGRHSAGALWLLLVFLLGASGRIHDLRDMYTAYPGGALTESARVMATLAFPFFTLADPTVVTPALVGGLCAASAAIVATAAVALSMADVPLRSRA